MKNHQEERESENQIDEEYNESSNNESEDDAVVKPHDGVSFKIGEGTL